MKGPQITLVRHAEPVRQGICYGWAHVEVQPFPADRGLQKLAETAYQCWSSDLARCQSVLQNIGLSFRTDIRLRELHFGDWEGRSWTEIWENDAARAQEWMDAFETARPPNGETWPELCDRVNRWANEQDSDSLVMCHAGTVRAMLANTLGLSAQGAFRIQVPPASATLIRLGDFPEVGPIGVTLDSWAATL